MPAAACETIRRESRIRTRTIARRDPLRLRPRGPRPRALRDLAALRAGGEHRSVLRDPAGARRPRALGAVRGAARRRPRPRPARGSRCPPRGYHPDFVNAAAGDAAADARRRARARPRDTARPGPARARLGVPGRAACRRRPRAFAAARRGARPPVDQMRAYWERGDRARGGADRSRCSRPTSPTRRARLAGAARSAAFGDLHRASAGTTAPCEVEHHYEARGRARRPRAAAASRPRSRGRRVWAMVDPPWQPSIIYPPRGLGALWEPRATRSPARSTACSAAAARGSSPRSTAPASTPSSRRGCARAPRASPSTCPSLRRAGLVAGRRDGRAVLYARTEAGDALLRAAGA